MKFEVMWNNEHRVMNQSWENFLLCYNRLVDILLPTIMAAAIKLFGDLLNFKLTTVTLELILLYWPETCRDLSKLGYQHCVKKCQKICLI